MGMKRRLLFGGDLKWNADDWTASDDRVRGGKSQSHLNPLPSNLSLAHFHGHLDTTTLGGAGFASQRTTSDNTTWDLSAYAGINLIIHSGDEKLYTFILKDELLGEDPETGRERASVSWEVDFRVREVRDGGRGEGKGNRDGGKGKEEEEDERVVFIPWSGFKPTYRGKEKEKDGKGIDLKGVRRMSLMMRSFFGTQEGDFSLTLRSIEAVKIEKEVGDGTVPETETEGKREDQCSGFDSEDSARKESGQGFVASKQQSWLQWIWERYGKL